MREYNAPMSGAQIASELGISKQAVSHTIRKSMNAMYRHILKKGMADSPFEAILVLMMVLGVENNNMTDIKQFLKLFDKRIIERVKMEAIKTYHIEE